MIALNYSSASQLNDSCCSRLLPFHLPSLCITQALPISMMFPTGNSHTKVVPIRVIDLLIADDAASAPVSINSNPIPGGSEPGMHEPQRGSVG